MKWNQCPECKGYKKIQYVRCYNCHMRRRKEIGVFRSLMLFLYMPCIPAAVLLAFGQVFRDMGFSKGLLFLFWFGTTIILCIIQWQEIDNMRTQIKRKNWF